jgi:hypothetical protein
MPIQARPAVFPLLAVTLAVGMISRPEGAAAQSPHYALTLYNTKDAQSLFAGPVDFEPPPGYAIIHERRSNEVGAGRGTLTLKGFPRYLDAGALSVALERGHVLSQRFEAEPLRSDRILERSVGRQVTVEQTIGGQVSVLTGELLSASIPLALRLEDGSIVTVNDYSRIRLPSPPAGFSAVPQLRLGVDSERAGLQSISLSYPTTGLAWRAEYVAQLKTGRECRLDFSGYAQIVNRSGHGFPGASIKLIAGEPQRSGAQAAMYALRDDPSLSDAPEAETVGDYYQYRLDTTVDIPDGSSQQVALIPEQRNARCSRERLYVGQPLRAQPHRVPITESGFGQGGERRIRSTLSFLPEDKTPIPAGRVRVLMEDDRDSTLEFMGEQQIGHTPAGQRLDVTTGDAFDLTGERRVSDFELDASGLGMSETVRVRLRNNGDSKATVRVREHLYRWTQWDIVESSQAYEKRDGDTIEFMVDVPADGEAVVSYRVGYRWTERFQ